MKLLDSISWQMAILFCVTLGLAPFYPPHVWEKLVMLSKGSLVKPIDWFDLVLHATPWLVLIAKIGRWLVSR